MAKKKKKRISKAARAKIERHPMTLGRPTSYYPELCDKLYEYFSIDTFTTDDNGQRILSRFPTMAGFAVSVNIHRSTLIEWAKIHEDFSDAYRYGKEMQEKFLLEAGVAGATPSTFAQFLLKNIGDYKDKSEVEHSGEIARESKTEEIDVQTRLKQLQAREEGEEIVINEEGDEKTSE